MENQQSPGLHDQTQSSKVVYLIGLDDDWKPVHTTRVCFKGDQKTIEHGIEEMKFLMMKDSSYSRIVVTEEVLEH